MNISAIDLNLLVVFDAVMIERNVTRAAKRVGLSQSGLSNALGRLREQLDDRLFLRTPKGMEPTRRARAIAPIIHGALQDLGRALSPPRAFDPKAAARTFRIATADLIEFVVLTRLHEVLARKGPHIDIEVVRLNHTTDRESLATGHLDMVIGGFATVTDPLRRQKLFDEEFVTIVREGHPVIKKRLTRAQFVRVGHVLVTPMGKPGGVVDRMLAEDGQKRRVAVTTPNFLTAPAIVANSDHVCTIPSRVANAFADMLPLRLHRPPITIPGFAMSMHWHSRNDQDPGHRWLREQLATVAETL